jgi:hypothetical protein
VHKSFVADGPGVGRVSLDSALADSPGLGLIKVDGDGAEVEVLRVAPNLLHRTDVGWLIEIHSKALEIECVSKFWNSGLHTHIPNA